MARTFQVTFDASDPTALAAFWKDVLGYVEQPPPPGYDSWEDLAREVGLPEEEWGDIAALVDPGDDGPRLLFLRVPEGKTAKNRMHLDVNVSVRDATPEQRRAQIDAEVDRLIDVGATKVADFDDVKGIWTVMQDPEGNEFCVQ